MDFNLLKSLFSKFFVRHEVEHPLAFLKKNLKHRCIYQLQLPEGFGLTNQLNFRPLKIKRSFILLETMRHPVDAAKIKILPQMEFTAFILEANKQKPVIIRFKTRLLEVISDTTLTIAPPQQFDSISSNKIDRFSLENRHHPAISLWGIDKRCANIRLLKMFNPLILYLPTANDTEKLLVDISSKGLCLSISKSTYNSFSKQFKSHNDILLQLVFRNPDMIQSHEFVIIGSIRYLRPNPLKGRIDIGIQFLHIFNKEPKPTWKPCKAEGIPELEWLLNEYKNFYLAEIKEKLAGLYQTELYFKDKLADIGNSTESSFLIQERLSNMNRVAFSICNNLTPSLSNIFVTLQYLSMKLHDTSEKKLLANSIYQLHIIAIKLGNIYEITSAENSNFSSIDVPSILTQTIAVFNDIVQKNNITLTVSIPDGLPNIQGNTRQLALVFNNLVLNAIESMSPQGGHLWLTASHDSEKQILCVAVEDTGGGIPSEVRGNIFQPYQNIQRQGAGMGLGLAVAQRIVASHGGSIDIRSTLGEGSTFTVRLPCLPDIIPQQPV